MAFKVFVSKDGPYAEADTLEEAAALLKQLNSNGHIPSYSGWTAGQPAKTTLGDIPQFFQSINENARKLLLALARHEKGIRGDQFTEETGVPSEKFGGIFGGASKIANKSGLKMEQFVRSGIVVKGSERYRFLIPGRLLLENAETLKKISREGTDKTGA